MFVMLVPVVLVTGVTCYIVSILQVVREDFGHVPHQDVR